MYMMIAFGPFGVHCMGMQLAYESLAVITNALMKLEVGSVGVSR